MVDKKKHRVVLEFTSLEAAECFKGWLRHGANGYWEWAECRAYEQDEAPDYASGPVIAEEE